MNRKLKLQRFAIIAMLITMITSSRTSAQWIDSLPLEIRESILWSDDYESGNLNAWQMPGAKTPGGGLETTGGFDSLARCTRATRNSGRYAALLQVNGAVGSESNPRGVRLSRWTDAPLDRGGRCLPDEAYYSTWMFVPMLYDPQSDWTVFEFRSATGVGPSVPIWSLKIARDESSDQLQFYLESKQNEPSKYEQTSPQVIPIGRWFHVEAFYKISGHEDGEIKIWQNGDSIFSIDSVQTTLAKDRPHIDWGIGNYTASIEGDAHPGTATLLFDDSVISTKAMHEKLGK